MGIDFLRDFPDYEGEKKPEKISRWFLAGEVSRVPRGKIRRYVLAGRPVAVFNRDGELVACRDKCPHMGADLSMGRIVGEFVECAWHQWRFSLVDGRCKKEWACLELYPVRVTGSSFEIEIPVDP